MGIVLLVQGVGIVLLVQGVGIVLLVQGVGIVLLVQGVGIVLLVQGVGIVLLVQGVGIVGLLQLLFTGLTHALVLFCVFLGGLELCGQALDLPLQISFLPLQEAELATKLTPSIMLQP